MNNFLILSKNFRDVSLLNKLIRSDISILRANPGDYINLKH